MSRASSPSGITTRCLISLLDKSAQYGIINCKGDTEMFYKVVIYKHYDGSKKLGHLPSAEQIVKMLKEGGSSHLGDSK